MCALGCAYVRVLGGGERDMDSLCRSVLRGLALKKDSIETIHEKKI